MPTPSASSPELISPAVRRAAEFAPVGGPFPFSRLLLISVIAVWLYILFLHGLGERDLWNSHEARAAMNARSILEDGCWLVPRLHDGRWELQKPPLYYWMVAGIARLTGDGVDALAVRLPSALAALVCVGWVAFLGRVAGGARAGLLAAVVLATAVHFTWLARVGRIDMPLTAAVAVAVGCFWVGGPRAGGPSLMLPARRACLLVAYLAVAVAVLLKGPIGLVLTVAGYGSFLLVDRRVPPPWRVRAWGSLLHELGVWWGLPLVLALTVPWFWLADRETGGELSRVFLWHHNVERGLGGSRLRGHPVWFYGPQFAIDFLPWSALLPLGLWAYFRRGYGRADSLARLGLAWFVGMAVVLSVVRYKRADYLVPAYPGAALFLGSVLASLASDLRAARRRAWLARAVAVVLVGSALGWLVRVEWLLPRAEARREHYSFARLVREHVAEEEPVVLFRTEAHALAFHLGPPIRSLVWWEELDALDPHAPNAPRFAVMPEASAGEWPDHLRKLRLEWVADNEVAGQSHEKPLVLFRIVPASATTSLNDSTSPAGKLIDDHARNARTATDRGGAH